MWYVKLLEESTCHYCHHLVLEGQDCLTDFDDLTSESTAQEISRHFHLRCEQCRLTQSCYESFASEQNPETTDENLVCTYCEHDVEVGQNFLADYLLIDKQEEANNKVGPSIANVLGFKKLPSSLKDQGHKIRGKFQRAGLGRGRGFRTTAEATDLYKITIPRTVRNLGEDAVKEFIKGKDASHIESVANAPSKVKSARNIIWEPTRYNRSRGSNNMTRLQRIRATAIGSADTIKIVAKTVAGSAVRGASIAILMEVPVSVAENSIHILKGKKDYQDALKDTAIDVGKAGVAGGVVAIGITVAVSLGAGPVIAVVAPALGVAGIGAFGVSTILRIKNAMTELNAVDNEFIEFNLFPYYFHSECNKCGSVESCYESFASGVSA